MKDVETHLELYPELNHSLLTTGILLHDIGKINQYSLELDIDYTTPGRLLGHIVTGDEMVAQALKMHA